MASELDCRNIAVFFCFCCDAVCNDVSNIAVFVWTAKRWNDVSNIAVFVWTVKLWNDVV